MATLREDVWREVLRFARAHDVDAGDTSWNMFDATYYMLKVVTTDPTRHGNRFDNGIHGSFEALHIPKLSKSGEVVVLWQPPWDGYQTSISPQNWWSCHYAYQWLNRELLPQVKDWIFKGQFGNAWGRLFRFIQAKQFADLLEKVVTARDLREPGLHLGESTVEGLLITIGALQRFFASSRSPSLYLKQHDVEALFLGAARVAGMECGNVNYVRGSLSLKDDPNNHAELADSINRHVQSGNVVASSPVVDYALRAILELLEPVGDSLPPRDKKFLQEALSPFIRQYDERKLLQRHYGVELR